jgi:uncharacterized membrane-anchored protein YhcB (DUF1043 family)|tara:strand:+ start:1426 stop:1677 length:252 start_codon:yes stop_codon:yes gene_type:complete
MIEIAEWVLIGILIGLPIGFIISNVLSSDKIEDLDTNVQDLRTQRQLLKEEIFRLSKSKPTPRKKRYYKPKHKRQPSTKFETK